ncbi:MAG: HD-GYP domain-containing protein, partial [Planctomycetes bacterium]|nr:HD-GYP domain-containing protein [Planctomycetota bacterium]
KFDCQNPPPPQQGHNDDLPEQIPDAPQGMQLSDMPISIRNTLDDILNSFDQINTDNETLVLEILNCYKQLNIAFQTTSTVAQCSNPAQAIQLLLTEISRAIECSFAIFLGNENTDFTLLEKTDNRNNILVHITKNEDPNTPLTFFQSHDQTLRRLAKEHSQPQTVMIDYENKNNPDHQGRGNVIAMPLNLPEKQEEHIGTMFFVRTQQQEPFIAVELSLAENLTKLGSVVLGNIIYAQKIHRTYLQIITSLVRAMEAKDPYTSGHSTQVAKHACDLARHIGLDEPQIKILETAGLMHDIGKIGIRDEVLTKPGKLTDEEFEHLKTHPTKGFKVLEPVDDLRSILGAVKHHHEHYDGFGYPDGLVGEDIPFYARIIQVADVWDALISTRSYRQAMPIPKAKQILRDEAGTTMDPNLVKAFLEMLEKKNDQEPVESASQNQTD